MGDKRETSVSSCGPRHPEWETSVWRQVGDKCKLMQPKAPRVGQGGDKCKLMRPKEPRVGDKCGRQVGDTRVRDKCGSQGGDKCKLMRPKEPRVGDKGETSVNSCGPRNPEWETRGRQV